MVHFFKKYKLSLICFTIVILLLAIVYLKTNNKIIIIERFFPHTAWLEILLVAAYAAFLIHKMKDPKNVPIWRQRSWFLFSVVFFGQLILGVIGVTILLRLINVQIVYAVIFGATFGIIGILVIIFLSKKNKKMIHCTVYCPVGTLISDLKYLNPFRLRIEDSCTMCAHCIPSCKYDALNIADLKNKKPGITCTLCGDCLSVCSVNSIQYGFLGLPATKARNLYLIISICLHAVFLALAKI